MFIRQLSSLALSALLTIGNGNFIKPAITWLNNSSLNITIGSSVNYYFDIEYNEWYPSSGSVDTAGTGRCDTNIIIGNGTDPMTGFIQYDRTALTRGTNLISYDDNVAVTSNMIYFYNVSSFTLTTFFSTDIGELNQPTFTVNFNDGYIWDERDDSDLYALMNLMLGDISAIKQNETNVYNAVISMGTQLGFVQSSIDAMALNIVSIDSKLDNIISYLSTINSNIHSLISNLKNFYDSYKSKINSSSLLAYNVFYDFVDNVNDNYEFTIYNYPYIKINRDITPGYVASSRFQWHKADGDCYLLFNIKDLPYISPSDFKITDSDGDDVPFSIVKTRFLGRSYNRIIKFSPTKNMVYYSITFNNKRAEFIPFYIGNLKGIPDDIALFFGIDKYEETTSSINQATSALETASATEEAFSQQTQQNFTNQIGQIDTNNSITSNSSFQSSANWVATQFNNLTNNNAYGSVLGFSLLLGLAMAIIGRVIK